MTYNQLVKKYGVSKVNDAYDKWSQNAKLRVKGVMMTTEIKGCAGKFHKCVEMIINGELI